MTVEQVLEEVKALTPEERQRVRAALDEAGETGEAELRERERAFVERLKAQGAIYQFPLADEEPAVDSWDFQSDKAANLNIVVRLY